MINIQLFSRLKNIQWLSFFDCFVYFFHREVVRGKNEYLYTSVLAYGTKTFISCDDLVVVVGAGGGISSVGAWIWHCIILKSKHKWGPFLRFSNFYQFSWSIIAVILHKSWLLQTNLAAHRCTFSTLSLYNHGDQMVDAYSSYCMTILMWNKQFLLKIY